MRALAFGDCVTVRLHAERRRVVDIGKTSRRLFGEVIDALRKGHQKTFRVAIDKLLLTLLAALPF